MSEKILHVVPSFGFGGMEKVICLIINGLPSVYHHEILSLEQETSARKWITNENVSFLKFAKNPKRVKFFADLFETLKGSNPNILMTYNWGATDAIWLGRIARIKHIIHHEHGFNVDEAKKRLWQRDIVRFIVYRLAKRTVVVSKQLQAIMQNSYRLSGRHVQFIPNGLDPVKFSPDPHVRRKVRDELEVHANETLVGFVGRLDPVKNLDFLLAAFGRCVMRNPSLKLILIGEGPERQKLESYTKQEGLTSHVRFLGQKDDVVPYLRAFDVFCLTSLREQMPMSLLEAMAMGIPVITTAVGDIPFVVKHEIEGFLIAGDEEEKSVGFQSALLDLVNLEKRQRMGRAARETVLSQFSEKAMLSQYAELCQRA